MKKTLIVIVAMLCSMLDSKELADINREFSEKHAGEIVAGELTKSVHNS